MTRIVLTHIDGKIHLALRGFRGASNYKHLAEIDTDLAMDLARYGIVCWEGSSIGRPVRPAILFTDHGNAVRAEIHENLSENATPVATFDISRDEALAVAQRNSLSITSWEGGEPDEDALSAALLAA